MDKLDLDNLDLGQEDSLLWGAAATLATLAAGTIARKALTKGWTAKRGAVPKPGEGDTSWREAALFAVVSGAAVGLARLLADRGIRAAKATRTA